MVNTILGDAPKIGIALGGGFARGIAHVGVLRVFEKNGIPIHCITGVSAGAMVAAAFGSGSTTAEIECISRSMKFRDVARWTINRLGLTCSDRMIVFCGRLLKVKHFEEMKIPIAIIATDLATGRPFVFRDQGEVITPIRASCSFPGLFQPVRHQNRCLIDGFVSTEVPALQARRMGATHVVSVSIPNRSNGLDPTNMFSVIDRCFQVMSKRLEGEWRRHSDLVIEPQVSDLEWDAFGSAHQLIQEGEKAASSALPTVQKWLRASKVHKRVA